MTAVGPSAKEAYAAVPICLAIEVNVHPKSETEFPSSFSGVKYHCAKQSDKINLPNVRINDDVQKSVKAMNQNLQRQYKKGLVMVITS